TAADTKARQFTDRPSAHRRRPHQPVTTPPTTAPASDQRARAACSSRCRAQSNPSRWRIWRAQVTMAFVAIRLAATPPATTEVVHHSCSVALAGAAINGTATMADGYGVEGRRRSKGEAADLVAPIAAVLAGDSLDGVVDGWVSLVGGVQGSNGGVQGSNLRVLVDFTAGCWSTAWCWSIVLVGGSNAGLRRQCWSAVVLKMAVERRYRLKMKSFWGARF
ncbi:hypothetical protein Dimus_005244, partial [Dionaea muscipula]